MPYVIFEACYQWGEGDQHWKTVFVHVEGAAEAEALKDQLGKYGLGRCRAPQNGEAGILFLDGDMIVPGGIDNVYVNERPPAVSPEWRKYDADYD